MRITDNTMHSLLMTTRNFRNARLASKMNGRGQQAQAQPRPAMPIPNGWSLPADPLSYRRVGINDHPQALNLTPGDMKFLQLRTCSAAYANAFLHGHNGSDGIGISAFSQVLSERGIDIPDDARFDISVDRYGKVTVTGLDNVELTIKLEEAMSFDASFIRSVLFTFVQSARILEGTANIPGRDGMRAEQHWLMQTQSELKEFGIGLHDLSIDDRGRIQGLPKELHDKIYGDRSGLEWWESVKLDHLRDRVVYFLQNGTAHIPAPDISLTFSDGRMTVNL